MADKKTVTVDAEALKALDANGDGHISAEEAAMDLEFKRKALEDQDAQRDAMRSMAWFSLGGMLLYPVIVAGSSWLQLGDAAKILGSMASVYFVSVAAIVTAFYTTQVYGQKK